MGAFTFSERCLCLGMGVGCTWISVFVKHSVRSARQERVQLPQGLAGALDTLLCAAAAGVMNVLAGKSLVKMILKKDWDLQKGVKGRVAFVANVWATVLSVGSLAHLAKYFISMPA